MATLAACSRAGSLTDLDGVDSRRVSAVATRMRLLCEADGSVARPAAAELISGLAGSTGGGANLANSSAVAYACVATAARSAREVDLLVRGFPPVMPRLLGRTRARLAALVPRADLASALADILRESFRLFASGAANKERFGSNAWQGERGRLPILCRQLVGLGFLGALQDAMGWVLFDEIDDAVRSAAESRLGDRVLPGLRAWIDRAVMPWLKSILGVTSVEPDEALLIDVSSEASNMDTGDKAWLSSAPVDPAHHSDSDASALETASGVSLEQWRKRLAFHLHETLANVRIEQMIQLVARYPNSLNALTDLKECLLCTDKKSVLVSSLRDQFTSFLLHAGTETSDILQRYINMIKALRFLDPAGVILESVSDPVKNCLRRRPDTVRSIVSGMTGDGDLFEELERGRVVSSQGGLSLSSAALISASSAALVAALDVDDGASDAGDISDGEPLDVEDFENWEPEPIDAPPRRGRWRPGGDAIATLVSIYGSSEQIVNEYRTLLADKLVNNFDLDLERETRILELLQQRFGVEAMHNCVIMLKDVRDSEGSLAIAQAESPAVADELKGFQAAVISKEFWPDLADEPSFKIPSEISVQMEMFGASFEKAKDPRKLRWFHGIGMTKMSLTFEDGRELSLCVSPLQAAIVLQFTVRSKWTVEELQSSLEISDEAALRRRLVLLANQDVIRATDSSASIYEAIERAEDLDSGGGVADDDAMHAGDGADDEEEHADDEASMTVYETYILAMLRNLKSLPLERIHSMLRMFCKNPEYDKNEGQLATFLAHLMSEEKIALQGGMYKTVD